MKIVIFKTKQSLKIKSALPHQDCQQIETIDYLEHIK